MLLTKFFLDENTKISKEALSKQHEKEESCVISVDCQIHDSCNQVTVNITDNVMSDVEVFSSYEGKSCNTLFEKLSDHVHTIGGKETLKKILEVPIYDTQILRYRQNVIREIKNDLKDSHIEDLKQLQKLEKDVHWIFEESDENMQLLYDMVYFRFFLLKPLNNNAQALTSINLYQMFMSPAIGILSPIVYFIAPFLILKYKFGDIISFSFFTYLKFMFNTFVKGGGLTDVFLGGGTGGRSMGSSAFRWISFAFSLLFYFQGIFNSVEVSKTVYRISKYLTQKAEKIITAITIIQRLLGDLWKDKIQTCFVNISNYEGKQNYPEAKPFSVCSDFGQSLKFIKNIDREFVKSILSKVYMIDCLNGCVTMLKSYQSIDFTEFITDEEGTTTKPHVAIKNTWHPCLNEDTTVKNSIDIDGHNIILTGPNAGGKSTFIKTVIINILLSQSLGIAFADTFKIRPFNIISTQINVPDMKGKESLFEAEMHRCKNTLDLIKKEGCKLVIMDEIFNSTNPVEGISGAYAVAKKISEHMDTLLIFTTHFTYLTKLAKKTNGRFVNYRMNVEQNDDSIRFPYILQKGISKQYVALELLKRNGFDPDIIEDAITIKNRLC